MNGYVYRFVNKDEQIIYVGSTEDLRKRLKQHFEHGHLGDYCYNKVLYVDYAEFRTRTEAYMYEQYEIAILQPEFNTNGKIAEKLELECFDLIKSPMWKRLYANSNYGYRYEKVYTNFEEENPHLSEPNRCYVLQMAEILNRFKKELKENIKILDDIEFLKEKCPTYISLIDISDLELLKQCMVQKVMHIDFYSSICNERFSDTDYDLICLDCSILKHIKKMKNRAIHEKCGMICVNENSEFTSHYIKQSNVGIYIPALTKISLQEIEDRALKLQNSREINTIETV